MAASIPAAPQPGRSNTPLIVMGFIVVLLAIGASVFVLRSPGGEEVAAGEIFLAPAAEVGPDPFSATPLASPPDPVLAQPVTEPAATVTPPTGVQTASATGGQPGLYGGTMNLATCNPQQIVDFLAANPDKAAAWVAALDADPNVRFEDGRRLEVALIAEYIATLTPMDLLADTRVTNHGFLNGSPLVLQSTLQKGTAVLVDKYGVPRVKCYCGNPLLPPVGATGKFRYTGNKWPDFNPTNVTVVQRNTTIINVFVLTDIKTGTLINRPVGTTGTKDGLNTGTTSTTQTPTSVAGTPTVPTQPQPTAPAPTTPSPTAAPAPTTPSPTAAPAPTTPAQTTPAPTTPAQTTPAPTTPAPTTPAATAAPNPTICDFIDAGDGSAISAQVGETFTDSRGLRYSVNSDCSLTDL